MFLFGKNLKPAARSQDFLKRENHIAGRQLTKLEKRQAEQILTLPVVFSAFCFGFKFNNELVQFKSILEDGLI